jgi:signal transduction histidine kinase
LYVAVLVADGYAWFAGLGTGHPPLFLGALGALFALDLLENRRWPGRTPTGAAITLLATRAVLFVVVAAADGAGLSRALFVLIPFTAYFAFGRATSIALGIGCVALVVGGYQLTAPRWYADVGHVSDLLMFCVGLALTIVMAAVAVRERAGRLALEQSHERLASYAAQVAELSAAAERNRVARDIHDELGHHLTAIAVLLDKARAFAGRDPEVAGQAIDEAHRCARTALDDVRRSVRTLRGPTEPFRLAPALADLVRTADAGPPAVSLDIVGDETGYGEPALTTLYRAAQEGITNARRHARASRVRVSVAFDRLGARLVVTDDGHGFRGGGEGYGLIGMRERVRQVDGDVAVDSDPGTGTTLTVTVPRRERP